MSQNTGSFIIQGPATATGVGSHHFHRKDGKATFTAEGTTSAGAGTSTILIEGSNVRAPSIVAGSADWVVLATITLTLGTTLTSDGFALNAPWGWVRSRISEISGTTATVTVRKGA